PTSAWQNDALIQVFLDTSAQDLAGNQLNNYQGSFRTLADTSTTAPVVVRSVPSGNGVVLNPVIEVEYNEALNPATVNATNVLLRNNDTGAPIPSTVVLRESRIIRIVPNVPLAPNVSHIYQTTTGIQDLDGTAQSFLFTGVF